MYFNCHCILLMLASTALVIWFHADDISEIVSGSLLAAWPDAGGQGKNATQAVPSQQPTYVANYVANAANGLPVVRFNSAASTSMTFNHVVQDDFTIICVFQNAQGIGTGLQFYHTVHPYVCRIHRKPDGKIGAQTMTKWWACEKPDKNQQERSLRESKNSRTNSFSELLGCPMGRDLRFRPIINWWENGWARKQEQ